MGKRDNDAVVAALADQLADAQRNAAQAVARVRELEGEREEAALLLDRWRRPGHGTAEADDTDAFLGRLTAGAAGNGTGK